jgi:transcriptional regulator with XRE-family HTH domain
MAQTNTLTQAPPYAVEKAIKGLGQNLRRARLRRNLTIEEVGEKIGTGPRPVANAEKGKPTTAMAVYVALLWTYDLLGPWNELADPSEDREGLALADTRERARTQTSKDLDDDF